MKRDTIRYLKGHANAALNEVEEVAKGNGLQPSKLNNTKTNVMMLEFHVKEIVRLSEILIKK